MQKEKFDAVFRDARVIDIDLSQWDRRVRIVVVALEETALSNKRLPIYAVDFIQSSEINIQFRHWNIPVPEGHFQWNAYDTSVCIDGDTYEISLSSSPQLPILRITCKDVCISSIENEVVDQINPGWNAPRQPLARPGIVELVSRYQKLR